MNLEKMKVMANGHVAPTLVKIGDSTLEVVSDYFYLGQTVQLGNSNFDKEVNHRIQLGWAAFSVYILKKYLKNRIKIFIVFIINKLNIIIT